MGTGGGLIIIDFSEQGNSASFRREGWSGQEADRVWSVGPRSRLRVPLQSSGRPMMLEAEMGPGQASPTPTGQIVRVRVNGELIGGTRLNVRSMIRCEIAPALCREDGILDVDFEFPGFYRPDMMRISKDDRPLAAWFSFVRVYTTDMFSPGPHFPSSRPDIPVVGIAPPFADTPRVDAGPSRADAEGTSYTFGREATVTPYIGQGWDNGEETFTWTIDSFSTLELPAPRTPGQYILRLEAWPFIVPDALAKQDVTVLLDGIVIGQLSLQVPTIWVMQLPRELTEDRRILPLNFVLPDATRGSELGTSTDKRLLSIAVTGLGIIPAPPYLPNLDGIRADETRQSRPEVVSAEFLTDAAATIEAALGLNTVELMRGFESLGDNCEFGIVQRKLGLEVLNLFRFGNVKLSDLMRALTDDVKAATDPAAITIELNDAVRREYVLTLATYNLRWHTFTYENEADEQKLWKDHTIKIGYLRRKFYEGLRGGRKIYVVKQRLPVPVGQAVALLMELNRTGRATLLLVEPASKDRRPGEVELIAPGLMRGYVTQFAPDSDVESADPTDWLRVCANATLLNNGPNALFRSTDRAV